MKKVLRFLFDNKEGFLSVVESDNGYYTLVKKDTPKVKDITNTQQLKISYALKTPSYISVPVKVSEDPVLLKWVFDKLKEQDNLYFKELDESLCVLEITKEFSHKA